MADQKNEIEADSKKFDSPMDETIEEYGGKPTDLYRIQQYYTRFRKAEMGKQPKHKLWQLLDEFDRSEQWKNTNIPPWVPKPVTNFIRYVRTLKRSNLASAIPKPTFSPENPEDAPFVSQLQSAHDHVWEKKHIDRLVRRCIDRALLQGTAIAYIYNDDNHVGGKYYKKGDARNQLYQGDICVKRMPNANFFPDPDAFYLDTCKYIETTEIVSINTVQKTKAYRDYCKQKGTLDKLDSFKSPMLEMDNDADGTIYQRDNMPENTNLLNQSGDYLITVHTHWERYLGDDNQYHLDVSYYIRNSDFFLLRIEDVKPSEYPFAILYDEEEENDFWGTSTCMDILENQKIINKIQQTAAVLGVLHQNPQKVVLRESGINARELARTGTLPGKVWTSNVPNPIEIVEPMPIPKELFELDDRTQKSIRDVVGVTEAYTGQSVGSLTTSTGVNDLIDRSTIRDKDKMVQVDEFVERLSHLIVLFVIHKWNEKRPIATQQPDGSMDHQMYIPLDDEAKENLEWRVKSDVYAKAPSTQASRRQQANQLLQVQGQFNFQPAVITPEEYMQMMEFDLSQDILKRMAQDRQMMAQQQANQPPKIAPNGEISFSLSSKDPNVVLDTLEEMMQSAQTQQQQQLQIQMAHAQNGMNIAPDAGAQGSSPAMSGGPQGTTGAVQMGNMMKGRM